MLLYDGAALDLLGILPLPEGFPQVLKFSRKGSLLLAGGLLVWEAFTGREYFLLRGHTATVTSVSWRDDSYALASAREDGTVWLSEMENGGQVRNWAAHGGGTESVKFAHDGRLVTAG